jgi:tyrosyl-tRNA synthetase
MYFSSRLIFANWVSINGRLACWLVNTVKPPKLKKKPIVLSHHMLYGLKAGQEKMSKSDPDSAVFMEDAPADVERKIMNAYCPSKEEIQETKTEGKEDDAGKESMHLVEEKIKNPCLDYIRLYSPPGAAFTAGGTTYSDFATVRNTFLAGKISEEELKRGLVSSLNTLLEPVRNHFANDKNAKNLLALVQQYKKEVLSKGSKVRRLNLVELGKVPAGSHLVFAPLPNATPTLQEAMDVLTALRQSNGRPRVLFLSDWSARVCNACDADQKGIAAYYTVLTTALKALDSILWETVQVVTQSEAILADPSNYWISVINVGRHFMLNDVMGPEMKDSDGAGFVIARLMRVADVAGIEPDSLALQGKDGLVESPLVEGFFSEKLPGVTKPTVGINKGPSFLLQQRESESHKTDNDEYFLLDDPKVRARQKTQFSYI